MDSEENLLKQIVQILTNLEKATYGYDRQMGITFHLVQANSSFVLKDCMKQLILLLRIILMIILVIEIYFFYMISKDQISVIQNCQIVKRIMENMVSQTNQKNIYLKCRVYSVNLSNVIKISSKDDNYLYLSSQFLVLL